MVLWQSDVAAVLVIDVSCGMECSARGIRIALSVTAESFLQSVLKWMRREFLPCIMGIFPPCSLHLSPNTLHLTISVWFPKTMKMEAAPAIAWDSAAVPLRFALANTSPLASKTTQPPLHS